MISSLLEQGIMQSNLDFKVWVNVQYIYVLPPLLQALKSYIAVSTGCPKQRKSARDNAER